MNNTELFVKILLFLKSLGNIVSARLYGVGDTSEVVVKVDGVTYRVTIREE